MTEIVAPELRTPFGIMTQVEREEIMLMVLKIPSEMEVALRYKLLIVHYIALTTSTANTVHTAFTAFTALSLHTHCTTVLNSGI